MALIALAPGCKVFDQPKRVDGLEQRVDELADAVSKLVGEPVAQRPKPKAKAHDDEADGEDADADPKARKARRPKTEARAGRDRGDRTAKADAAERRPASAKASHDEPAEEPADTPADADPPEDDADEPAPPPADHGPGPHWAYTGAEGPSHWGELDEQYAACGDGHEQSPIDILPKRRAAQDESVFFVYKPTPGKVTDNGHTLQVDLQPGSYAVVDGARYELVQFHFHTPSEHTIAGEPYAMEVHLVHKNKAGKLAVVGVLFADGAPSAALAPVWKQLPKAGGSGALKKPFDPSALLPSETGAYRYAGSLTTPPCSEGVKWIVLRRTGTDAEKRIAAFRARFGANARPTQSMGERELQ
ncbi:MAG: carbonic anhydrase family protein [Myxococcales bacterium]|nr:carbonic anhydrase family protein [Myxococcales bacterium]